MTSEIEAYLDQARQLHLQQAESEALLLLEEALSQYPEAAELHSQLAQLYLASELYEQAGTHFQAARAFAPQALSHTVHLVAYFLFLGQRRDALLYLQEALQMSTEPESLFPLLARIMLLFGRHQDAEAAWLQSLESGQASAEAQLDLLRFYLRERRFEKALIMSLQQQSQIEAFQANDTLWAEACHLWAWSHYWQGELAQARDLWRESLNTEISAAAFYALMLALPLVYQDQTEVEQWQSLLHTGSDILVKSQLPPPMLENLLELPFPALLPPCQESVMQATASWLQSFYPPLPQPPLQNKTHYHLGLMAPNLASPEIMAWLQTLHPAPPPENLELSLFYLQPDHLPPELSHWEAHAFQIPAHLLALQNWFQAQPVDALAYFDLSPELYLLALQRAAPVQMLMPTCRHNSGLPSMDFVLSVEAEPPWDANVQNSERPLPIAPPQLTLPSSNSQTLSRQDWNLPRLGHLYLLPAEPQYWLPEQDQVISEILQRDRKAFILGLQLPGSTLHTRIMQRHEHSLSGRQRRVRWLKVQPTQWSDLFHLVDILVDPLEYSRGWLTYQALNSGVPVVTCPGRSRSSRQASLWLKQMGFEDWITSSPELQAELAVKLLCDRNERVMLKQRLEQARLRLASQSENGALILTQLHQTLREESQSESSP